VFKRNANAIGEALRLRFGEVEVSLNPDGKPKRGSFEVVLSKGEEEVVLWSGLTKGPPRKLKFPATEEIVKLTEEHV